MSNNLGVHDSRTCRRVDGGPCEVCAGIEARAAACVIHSERRATYAPQGLRCCDECYLRYSEEYASGSNTQLLSRPFLQQLIRASADEACDEAALGFDAVK